MCLIDLNKKSKIKMKKNELPIAIYQLALLQAYLYEIFSIDKKCEKNFKYTEWYLRDNFSAEEVDAIIKFFKDEGINCDCDILRKLDLRKLANDIIKFHK